MKHAIVRAAASGGFDPAASVTNFRALLLGLVSLALIVISLVGLFVAARKGNPGRAASIVAATVICLVPLALAVGVGAAAFGAAFLDWAVPGISK